MLARIGDAMARERAFVADASHELRTPLAILRAELDLALAEGRSPDELRAALASAAEETDRLTQLSEDLLTIAQTEARQAAAAARAGAPRRRLRAGRAPLLPSRRRSGAGGSRSATAASSELRGDLLRLDQASAPSSTTRCATAPGRSRCPPAAPATRSRSTSPTTGRASRPTSSIAPSSASAARPASAKAAAASASRSSPPSPRPTGAAPTPPTAPRAAPTSGSSSRSHLTLIRAPEDRTTCTRSPTSRR